MAKKLAAAALAAASLAMASPAVADYNSVVITVEPGSDPALFPETKDERIQKMVFSTQSLTASMIGLFDYYGESGLLASESTIAQFQQAATAENPVFIYRTRENLQIVLSMQAFDTLVEQAGSRLAMVEQLLDTVGKVITDIETASGEVVPLTLFDYSREG